MYIYDYLPELFDGYIFHEEYQKYFLSFSNQWKRDLLFLLSFWEMFIDFLNRNSEE